MSMRSSVPLNLPMLLVPLGGKLRSVRKIAVVRPNTDHLWFVKGNKSARVDRVCASGWTTS